MYSSDTTRPAPSSTGDIRDRIRKVRELPTLPIVLTRLMAILRDERASIQDLAEVIRKDQALSTKIVALANAPFFGFQGMINSVEQAILLLGFDLVKSIAVSVSIFSMFPVPYPTLRKMWGHSYRVAMLSGALAKKVPGAHGGVSFLAGLLHDVGRAVFMSLSGYDDRQEEIKMLPLLRDGELFGVESHVYGCTHADAGAIFLEDLSFPEEIRLPVLNHHDIYNGDAHRSIVITVFLAEGISGLVTKDPVFDGSWTDIHRSLAEGFGIDEAFLDECKTLTDSAGGGSGFF